MGINDSGQIAANGVNSAGQQHAFLLTPASPGDANLDGKVNVNDLAIVLAHYGQTVMSWSTGDFNSDAKVSDINDLTIVLANYGQSVGASGGMAAVPEPCTVTLLLGGLMGLLYRTLRRRRPRQMAVVVTVLATLGAGVAHADVFNLPSGQTSLVTVPVGNAGNAADTRGFGAVGYNYSIGKYDVTNAQYCEFLNAKASAGDPLALWNSYMSGSTYGEGGISRSGGGPYTYTVNAGMANQPVCFVMLA